MKFFNIVRSSGFIFIPLFLYSINLSAQDRLSAYYWRQSQDTHTELECVNFSNHQAQIDLQIYDEFGGYLKTISASISANAAEKYDVYKNETDAVTGVVVLKSNIEHEQIQCRSSLYQSRGGNIISAASLPSLDPIKHGSIVLVDRNATSQNLIVTNTASSAVELVIRAISKETRKKEDIMLKIEPFELRTISLTKDRQNAVIAYEVQNYSGSAELRILNHKIYNDAKRSKVVEIGIEPQVLSDVPFSTIVSSTEKSRNQLLIYSPDLDSAEFMVRLVSSAGEIVDAKVIKTQNSIAEFVLSTEEYARLVASLEIIPKNNKTKYIAQLTAVGLNKDPAIGIDWAYAINSTENKLSTGDEVAFVVDTTRGVDNFNRYLETNGLATECTLDVFDINGIKITGKTFSLKPTCKVVLDLKRQIGDNFFGAVVAKSATPDGLYSAELLRVFYDREHRPITLMRIPGSVRKRSLQSLARDPEVLTCSSSAMVMGVESLLTEQDRQKLISKAYDLAQQGFDLANKSEYAAAIQKYREAVRAYPKLLCARVALARNLRLNNQLEAAQEQLEKASLLEPGNKEVLEEISNLKSALKDFDGALASYRALLHYNDSDAFYHAQYAWAALSANKTQIAIAEFKRALELDKRFVSARDGLADAYERTGAEELARHEYLNIVSNRDDTDYLLFSTQTRYTEGSYYEAVMRAYYKLQDYNAVVRLFKSLASAPQRITSMMYSMYALALDRLGLHSEAINVLIEARQKYSADYFHFQNLVYLYQVNGMEDVAINLQSSNINTSLDPAQAKLELAAVLIHAHKLGEAEKLLVQLQNDNFNNSNIFLNLGVIAEQRGMFENARDLYLYTLQMDVNNARAHANLADLELKSLTPDFNLALTYALNGTQLAPSDPYVLALLGKVYLRMSQYDNARYKLEQSLNIDPRNVETIEIMDELNREYNKSAECLNR